MNEKIIVETVRFNQNEQNQIVPQKIQDELDNGFKVKEMNVQPYHEGNTFPTGVVITVVLQNLHS